MTFVPRRIAALAVLITMFASLATAGVAMAATAPVTAQDCEQGTIKDERTGQPISRERCQQLIGKNVSLASTGFDLRPVIAGGVLLLLGAGALGLRRRGAPQLT
jgi:hypothetical protein